MTRKEQILRMVGKLPDDVSYERVIYQLDLMKSIEISIEQIERGEGIPHEEFMAELRAKGWLDDDTPDSSGPPARKRKSKRYAAKSAPATTREQRESSSTESSPQPKR